MNKLFVILFTLMVCSVTSAQQKELDAFNNLLLRTMNDNGNVEIKGSPYTAKEMINGTIYYISGSKIEDIPLRYNWYTNEMEVMYKGSLRGIPPLKDIDHIQIGDERYVPFYNMKEIKGYMVQLYHGRYSLFRKENIRLIQPKPAQSGYEEAQPAKYESYGRVFYVISPDGGLIELERKAQKLAHQFPDQENEIILFIKKHKLNVKKEEDLIELFQMLDSRADN